ncbi:MAG: hypothetical protein JW737_01390 [Acidobacteria bacterium]|nr:hypothetical protein [Acidobacteriota bacterium]
MNDISEKESEFSDLIKEIDNDLQKQYQDFHLFKGTWDIINANPNFNLYGKGNPITHSSYFKYFFNSIYLAYAVQGIKRHMKPSWEPTKLNKTAQNSLSYLWLQLFKKLNNNQNNEIFSKSQFENRIQQELSNLTKNEILEAYKIFKKFSEPLKDFINKDRIWDHYNCLSCKNNTLLKWADKIISHKDKDTEEIPPIYLDNIEEGLKNLMESLNYASILLTGKKRFFCQPITNWNWIFKFPWIEDT